MQIVDFWWVRHQSYERSSLNSQHFVWYFSVKRDLATLAMLHLLLQVSRIDSLAGRHALSGSDFWLVA